MRTRKLTLETFMNETGIEKSKVQSLISETLSGKEQKYVEKLKDLFDYGFEYNINIFSNKINYKSEDDLDTQHTNLKSSFSQWADRYINNIENPTINAPLKNEGEIDEALITRIATIMGITFEEAKKLIPNHFLFMSAENTNGQILEEFLSKYLENYGWIWCAGSIFRACDFIKIDKDKSILLQVKNKYNTENSSSSAIRQGTQIIKWNRLKRPSRNEPFKPIENWTALHTLLELPEDANKQLTESNYLKYIKNNTKFRNYA